MGVRALQRSDASQLLPLQHAKMSVPQIHHSLFYTIVILQLSHSYLYSYRSHSMIPYLSLTYAVFTGYCAQGAPTSICPGGKCWFARPQLYFTCQLRSRDGRLPIGRLTYGKDDFPFQLMFYSTFEVLDLPGSGLMETRHCRVGTLRRLFEPSSTPILYVCPVSNVLGRVPLIMA